MLDLQTQLPNFTWRHGGHGWVLNKRICQYQKYHNTLCPPKILHKHCFHFLLGLLWVPRKNKNNTLDKNLGGQTKSIMVFLILANIDYFFCLGDQHGRYIYCLLCLLGLCKNQKYHRWRLVTLQFLCALWIAENIYYPF